jgi:hypothetical protein
MQGHFAGLDRGGNSSGDVWKVGVHFAKLATEKKFIRCRLRAPRAFVKPWPTRRRTARLNACRGRRRFRLIGLCVYLMIPLRNLLGREAAKRVKQDIAMLEWRFGALPEADICRIPGFPIEELYGNSTNHLELSVWIS